MTNHRIFSFYWFILPVLISLDFVLFYCGLDLFSIILSDFLITLLTLIIVIISLYSIFFLIILLKEENLQEIYKFWYINIYLFAIQIFYGITSLEALNEGNFGFYISLIMMMIIILLSIKVSQVLNQLKNGSIVNGNNNFVLKILFLTLGSFFAFFIYVGEMIKGL